MKFIKFYLLKRQNRLKKNYYVQIFFWIIVSDNAKQYKAQILFEHFDIVENNSSDDVSFELVYVRWDFGDCLYDNSKSF
jgi:hypothetical protein